MFTGIIQAIGRLRRVRREGVSLALEVECPFASLALGESVATDGVCLTVSRVLDGAFAASASAETLARSTLGSRAAGHRVNLERALAVGDRLGGHIVAGHVDGVGTLRSRERVGDAERATFAAPDAVMRFIAEKGSVAIDGVSLTVNRVGAQEFDVMLVPFTQDATTLRERTAGDTVNLEADVLARYVARALGFDRGEARPDGDDALRALLERNGYMR